MFDQKCECPVRMDRSISVDMQRKEELRSLFEEVDADSSGYVSNRELRDFLLTKNHKLPFHVLVKIYENADKNSDGRLDLAEFTNMVYDPSNRDFFADLFQTCLNKYVSFILPPQPAKFGRSFSVRSSDGTREYNDLIKCWPPPMCMLVISILEVLFFAIDASYGNITGTGPVARNLIYNPERRWEIWRYVTYMFVHIGYVHIVMNLLVQILLGVILEVFHRWWRVLLIYLTGVLAGSLGASVFDPTHQLAGASGGVYSLITAHVATIILNWNQMRFPLSNLMIFFAFTVGDLVHVFHMNEPHIGHTTHFCGALAGLLVGILILRNISVNRNEKILQLIALIVYIGLMGASVIWNFVK